MISIVAVSRSWARARSTVVPRQASVARHAWYMRLTTTHTTLMTAENQLRWWTERTTTGTKIR